MRNLRIVICDDNSIQVELLEKFIGEFQSNYEYEIISSLASHELLDKINNSKIDIAFLDIEIDSLSGLEIAKHIRSSNQDVIIVFITGFKEYSFDSFEVKPFDYILKPLNKERFIMLFNSILNRYEEICAFKNLNDCLWVHTKDNIVKLKYDKIYYFEKNLRKINIHTKDNKYSINSSIKELMEKLDHDVFIQCHQGYIVNIDKVANLYKNFLYLVDTTETIPVSRRFKKNILNMITNKVFL